MHWFIDPIKEHYFDFDGRATLQQFWMFVLTYILIYVALAAVDAVLGLGFLSLLFSLVIFIPSISITARRLHDIGKSGWWQLIGLVPLIGLIVMIVWCATKGEEGSNAYGPAAGGVAGAAPTAVPEAGAVPEQAEEQPAEFKKAEENTQQGYGN